MTVNKRKKVSRQRGSMSHGWGAKKKEAAPATTTAVSVSSGSMPSVDSAEFGEWVAKDGNLEKMLTA